MDEFKIPINCNIISGRESFGYNYRLMKYMIKPHITSLFQNNNMYHCNCNNQLLQLWLLCCYSCSNNN